MNHSQTVSFVWGVADLVRDTFKRGKYRDVILPLTVLRRLDCVPAPNKRQVLEVQARYKGKLENLDPQLRRASGFAFYNTSRYDFEKLLDDAPHIARNLRNYIAGFSPNMREVLEKFDFDHTISKLDEAGLLFQVMQRFGDPQVNLHPDVVDNAMMGTILEEPIRKFNEALNENPGEHFTPRDVVHLMVDLLIAGDEERLHTKGVVLSVYDPCCGSGGMVTIAKEHIKITVEGPLKLDFQATSERIARLDEQSAFRNLAVSRKKGAARMKDEQAGRARQAAIRELLASLPDRPFLDRDEFESALGKAARKAGVKLAAPIRKTILSALSQRNEKAQVCRDKDGSPEPDVDYRGKTPEKTPFGVRLVTAKNIKNQT
ncbi:MAG: SAM-dependent DNA methyltransferase, partial [Acidobacteria bacterium]|nr:SAM-dependent DNA methyltransferase [Acidobacteriota bacterium]